MILLTHIVIIHLAQLPPRTAQYQRAAAKWSIDFVKHTLILLNLEASPALCVMKGALRNFSETQQSSSTPPVECSTPSLARSLFSTREKTSPIRSEQEHQEASIEDFMNAQPAKLNFLAQCNAYLKEEVEAVFAAVSLILKVTFCVPYY